MKRIHAKYLKVTIAFVVLLCLTACGASGWQKQYDLGTRYLSEGNYEEAVIAFTVAIKIDKKQPLAYIGRGNAYIGTGETDETLKAALEDYIKAIELDETNADAWLGLADVYIRQGEYDKAAETLQQALEKTNQAQAIADKLKEVENGIYKDSSGNVRKEIIYDGAGNIIGYAITTYQPGNLTRRTSFDSNGNQIGYVESSHDEQGNVLIDNFVSNNRNIKSYKLVYDYDDRGNRIRVTHYNHDGSILFYTDSEYDENGNVVCDTQYNVDGKIESFSTFEYDELNRMVRSTSYHGNNSLSGYCIYEYDKKGNIIHMTYYEADGTVSFDRIYEYDETGKRIRSTEYSGDGSVREIVVTE